MNAVLFQSQLLAIAREQIHVIVIAFVNLEDKIHLASQINHAGNTLLTDSHKIIPCLRHRGQKPYPV